MYKMCIVTFYILSFQQLTASILLNKSDKAQSKFNNQNHKNWKIIPSTHKPAYV